MKQITALLISLFLMTSTHAQVKRDTAGNFTAQQGPGKSSAKPTGKTYTARDGKVYPVFISVNGKYFVRRVSKSGNTYNYYLN